MVHTALALPRNHTHPLHNHELHTVPYLLQKPEKSCRINSLHASCFVIFHETGLCIKCCCDSFFLGYSFITFISYLILFFIAAAMHAAPASNANRLMTYGA